ncbi:Ammonium Transporter (Amt) Family [Thraustotheca clavata]|uniref:Ammonium transporter n=1 Tax=Thraustotheca clavata TaxID=74557 RepID=A0A1W0A259_9STRA|nr:Ammonium Transporter (Amt) Family [Thraustotheca clavata]
MSWSSKSLIAIALLAAYTTAANTTMCEPSQYLDSNTNACVNYTNQQAKVSGVIDGTLDSGNTAWMLISSALVMIMTPGVAFFYAGLAGEDMASNTMMMSFMSMAVVSIQFFLFGYSASFGSSGVFSWAFYNDVGKDPSGSYGVNTPHILYAFFQTQFAMITPALLSGGIVGRMKFGSYLLFILLWTSIVYDPLAHWMWSFHLDESWVSTAFGWEGKMGALDFAGGTVIHISSGFGALAGALVVGGRYNQDDPVKPHNIPLVMLGTTLLWFGWFGFNAGSEGAADGIAAIAAINTHLAPCAGFLTWSALEYAFTKKFDPCGAASGAVSGLVAITPGCGYVLPWAAVIFGVIGAITGFSAVRMKNKLRYDDTLDSFAIHGCAGVMGGLLTGLFANPAVNPNIVGGAFYGHGMQFLYQLAAQCVSAAYSFFATTVILLLLKATIGLRVSEEKEINGIDNLYHGGQAYGHGHITQYSSKDVSRETSLEAGAFENMMTPSTTEPVKAQCANV